ncbi:MAG TPA: cytidine deaminase [Anaerolineales bacterium]|nr:cytidine deaminase [Anaerolineales bacterium]HRQ92549.1 cytidine deaminase [Anaerolineales bacterium]
MPKNELVQAAHEAQKAAYAPYSNYRVGAALRTKAGKIYLGANIENAAYPDGICAERVAMFTAIMQGEREFDSIAVVTRDGGSPCGSCRQVLAEFALKANVLLANQAGEILKESTVEELLPGAFLPSNLNVKP